MSNRYDYADDQSWPEIDGVAYKGGDDKFVAITIPPPRCHKCGSSSTWADNLAAGCNTCGAMFFG